MNIEQWDEQYKPITNPLDPDASWNGVMFETYGDELRFVMNQPARNVWTYVDGSRGTYLVNGYHIANRIGYFVTANAWDICVDYCIEVSRDEVTP